MRLIRRSRLIVLLACVCVLFWFILYWNFLSVYANHKRRLNALKQLDQLPDDQFPAYGGDDRQREEPVDWENNGDIGRETSKLHVFYCELLYKYRYNYNCNDSSVVRPTCNGVMDQ